MSADEKSQFNALEDGLDGNLVSDKEPEVDQATTVAIVCEVDLDGRLLPFSASETTIGCIAIAKLQALANKIVNSPTIKADLELECICAGKAPKMMICDVSTWWNRASQSPGSQDRTQLASRHLPYVLSAKARGMVDPLTALNSFGEMLACEEWKNKYKPSVSISDPRERTATSDERFADAKQYFAVLHNRATPGDALEKWLMSPVISTAVDPISYWSGMLMANHPLARMALDFLFIPVLWTSNAHSQMVD
ncbi:hypothetical protein BDZ97DRAFT_1926730 [Flammula alnicola]|nr:hypothetical protein BDZ97DRAFT_1926730 [Flammula alnicola]